MSTPVGTPPVVFETPTLGRAVCLGELYDQRSSKFLGVQLYPQENVQEVVTDIRHTALFLSLSSSHEQKSSLLDIKAKLSLEVLGGLVKVSGSASYLSDEKSNSHEYAYALALKMRLNERRLLFAEEVLGREVLPLTQEDYIGEKLATHFVSSITYGGNYIVNMVARKSEFSKEEKIEGKLQAEFNKLKGAISLSGSVEAKIKGKFSNMNDKFDLVIHGDVALETVPINPQDVLDTFPDAASMISDHGGVPISVTLQPIPKKLITGSLIYRLNADLVQDLLKAFSTLEDLGNRFSVLQSEVVRVRSFAPELERTCRVVTGAFQKTHNNLLHELGQFLYDYQHGKKHEETCDKGTDCPLRSGERLLQEITRIRNQQLDPEYRDLTISKQYPASLAGLEIALTRFQDLVSDIRIVRTSMHADDAGKSAYLSSINDVCRALRTQQIIRLFVMLPMAGSASQPDLTAIRYFALIRKGRDYFKDKANPPFLVYAEDPTNLDRRLCQGGKPFSELEDPSLLVGTIDEDGFVAWEQIPCRPRTLGTFKNYRKPAGGSSDLVLDINGMDGTKTFSFQILATSPSTPTANDLKMCFVRCAGAGTGSFLKFFTPFRVLVGSGNINSDQILPVNGKFMATFIQDRELQQWSFYFNDKKSKTIRFELNQLVPDSTKLQLVYPASESGWWTGEVFEVRAFSGVLSANDIRRAWKAWNV